MAQPLFLVGFMAAGKSTVGAALAGATGRRFVDLDDAIATAAFPGMDWDPEPVASLVARDEAEFRRREARAIELVSETDAVIATGGGAAAFGDNLSKMRAAGLVVALHVDVAEAERRAANGPPRPLLAHAARLAVERAPIYRGAHAVIETMQRTVEQVVDEVRHVERVHARHRDAPGQRSTTIIALGPRSYPIVVADRVDPAALVAAVPGASRFVAITDRNVAAHHLDLLPPGTPVIEIEPGEASKSFATYERLCIDLVARGLDRSSAILALGGGVVGDLAGFVAATLYRGIPVVQIPTTIVAMTDAAIGGKTAIDLPAGKNLVGAFHQPRLVACSTATLATLPQRDRRAGFGELWKYALLDGPALWRAVAACAAWGGSAGASPPPPELRQVIDRAVAFKAEVVGRDELERTGLRAILNLGHTIGHAIEAASGMLHGEAVALGLVAAVRVSAETVGVRHDLEAELVDALASTGLATDLDPWLTDDILARVLVDKKRIGGTLKFITVRDVGRCETVEIAVTELSRILRPRTVG